MRKWLAGPRAPAQRWLGVAVVGLLVGFAAAMIVACSYTFSLKKVMEDDFRKLGALLDSLTH